MPDTPDARLLEQFVRNGSEEAFTALVQRHIGLVHSVALRHTTHPQHAEDITQAVFIILARKADRLGQGTVLPGWLYHTARLTAANWQRAEARRVRREQEAFMQSQLEETPTDNLWRELSPQLDLAMAGLGTVERDALVLRYFQNKGLAEVGQSLGLSENAAQKRVHQALEKLRRFFSKRGVDATAGHIADMLSTHSVQAVPAALVKSVTAVALAKGTAATTSTLTLIKGAWKIMAWTKANTAIVSGVVLLLAAGTVRETIREIQEPRTYPWQVHSYDARVLDRAPPQVRILPVKENPFGGYGTSHGKMMGIRQPANYVVKAAYGFNQPYTRISLLAELPKGSFDFIASLPDGNAAALQEEVKRRFGVVAKRELQETNVFLLKVKYPNRLLPGVGRSSSTGIRPGQMNFTTSMSLFALDLENYFRTPVLDRTGRAGDFTIDLKWAEPDSQHRNPDGLKQALTEELGLELVPSRGAVETLVVEKAK